MKITSFQLKNNFFSYYWTCGIHELLRKQCSRKKLKLSRLFADGINPVNVLEIRSYMRSRPFAKNQLYQCLRYHFWAKQKGHFFFQESVVL